MTHKHKSEPTQADANYSVILYNTLHKLCPGPIICYKHKDQK